MEANAAFSRAVRKWRVGNGVVPLVLAAILIGGSGRIDWIAGWAYVVLAAAAPFATYLLLARKCPDLLVERARLQPGTKPWDKVLAPLVSSVFPLTSLTICALDTRFGWSGLLPVWRAAGFLLVVLGILLILWAMAVNRFFAATVRIQEDRGHRVVAGGPYAIVRHPGYLGMVGYMLGTPLALDSLYALMPAAACVATLVLRTALEDRTLRSELAGYADYARSVRARLIPALW